MTNDQRAAELAHWISANDLIGAEPAAILAVVQSYFAAVRLATITDVIEQITPDGCAGNSAGDHAFAQGINQCLTIIRGMRP